MVKGNGSFNSLRGVMNWLSKRAAALRGCQGRGVGLASMTTTRGGKGAARFAAFTR